MRLLLSDKLVAKLRKIPSGIWFVLLAASFFLSDAYILIADTKTIALTYNEVLAEYSGASLDTSALSVVSCIVSVFLNAIIFEIIIKFAYNMLRARFVMAINIFDFSFRLRWIMILCNIAIGIVSITYFFAPITIGIISAVIDFVIPTLFFAFFYEDFRKRYLPKSLHARVLYFAALIYMAIYTAISAISFVVFFTSATDRNVLDIIAYCIDLGLKLAFIGFAYAYYIRLKKVSTENEDNDLFIKKEEKQADENVFKDFNF